MINFSIEVALRTREAILKIIDAIDIDTLNKIPDGFNNNLVWHFGHIIVTPQILCYKKSNVPCTINDSLIEKYAKGTRPEGIVSAAELEGLKSLLFKSVEQLASDYKEGKFGPDYDKVVTSMNVTLDCVEKAVEYCAAHDNLHFGYIQALRRAVIK